MKELRLAPHNAFTRQTRILGKPGMEAQITLETVGCNHGKCTFCGLGKTDSRFKEPLGRKGLMSQLKWAKDALEQEMPSIRKASVLINSHSVFESDVIRYRALIKGMHFIINNFPALAQLSLESRANLITKGEISKITRALGYPPLNFMELAVGIESGTEWVRQRQMRKGLTDVRIYETAHILAEYGWAMRAYFIYNCPGRPFEARTEDFKLMARLLAELKKETGVTLTLYANRGYVPEGLESRFRDFRIANEHETIKDIAAAAKLCKDAGVTLDADVTGSDEALTHASALEIKPGFAQAVSEFNAAQEIGALLGWLSRSR
ncbi:Uncharacterised protein [uncultured archaeon]|nr:Uncharacterised protein [uncultured archaeon]